MIIRGSTIALLLFSLFLITQAKKYKDSADYDQEFKEFKEWKKSKNFKEKEVSTGERDSGEKEENRDVILQREDKERFEKNYEKSRKDKFYKKKKGEDESVERSDENKRWKDDKKRDYQKIKKSDKKRDYEKITQDKRKSKEYKKKKSFDKSKDNECSISLSGGDPPPIDEAALMARYIVNQANWTSVATISSRKDISSFPSANVISFSDGHIGNGSGIPYMFLTPLDFTAQDIFKDNRATLMMTLAQGCYCHKKNYDPMDPRCARVILTGQIISMKNNSAELEIAKNAVFGRHPWLQNMPPDHHFFFAKLEIASIAMLDTFGGPKFVPVDDYLHPPAPNGVITAFSRTSKLQESSDIELQELDSDSEEPNVRLL